MQAVVFKKEGYENLQVPLPAVVQVLQTFCCSFGVRFMSSEVYT